MKSAAQEMLLDAGVDLVFHAWGAAPVVRDGPGGNGAVRGAVFESKAGRRAVLAQSLSFAKDRYEAGYASYLEQIDAQRNLFQAEIEVINLRQSQLDNLIALYRALGGGWSADAVLAGGAAAAAKP